MMNKFVYTLPLLTIALLGCPKKEEAPAQESAPAPTTPPPPPAAPTPAPTPTPGPTAASGEAAPVATASAEAEQIFQQRCVICHGASGKGDGAAAAGLNPKPRDYTDATWQKTVKDEEIAKAILEGGAAVGKSAAMPPNPDLKDKPAIVQGLVAKVRSFAAK